MQRRLTSFILLIIGGCFFLDVADGQAATFIADLMLNAREVMHTHSEDYPYWEPPVALLDGIAKPVDNPWTALSLTQLPGNLSEGCVNGTTRFLQDLLSFKPWTLLVLDATAKMESGILTGNIQWLGSFTECQNILLWYPPGNHSGEPPPDEPYFDAMPCTVTIMNTSNINPAAVGIKLGVCMPSACSAEDVSLLMRPLTFLLPADFGVARTSCYPDKGPEFDAAAIVLLFIFSCLGALIVAGTLYDILVVQGGWTEMRSITVKEVLVKDAEARPAAESAHDTSMTDLVVDDGEQRSPGVVEKILVSFSIVTNGSKILATKKTSGSLDAIHGIRFISMTWVILGHSYAFGVAVASNMFSAYTNTIKTWHFQAILNASVSVDSFFLLSGTLVAYLLLRELDKCGGPRKLSWGKFYFHRLWRLTPPYMLILGFDVALIKYLGTGPLWPQGGFELFCKDNWWTNLLYINNIVHPNEQCFGWSWYLANDMQFFIISPIFVVSLFMNWIVGLVMTLVVILASTVAIAVITVQHGYGAELVSTFNNPNMVTWMQDIYFPPWCRIGPYLVGILCGYLIFKTKMEVKMNRVLVILGWIVAAATGLAIVYGLYDEANGHPLTTPVAAFYSATHRTVWGVMLAWVIFACVTGYGGWVNKFLSWPVFVPLSRLTYMAYLVHPLVMWWYYYGVQRTLYYDTATAMYLFLGNLVLSYGVSFIASLSVESPMMGLEKVFLKR